MDFDVLIVGDLRFLGGTSTSIASDIQAMHRAGYSVGLYPIAGPVLKFPHPINKSLKALIFEGAASLVPLLQPVSARLCLLHHPQVFADYPLRPLNISADIVQLIVHHPPRDGTGAMNYDVVRIDRVVTDLLGHVSWAPVGPKVRDTFQGLADCPTLTALDWLNIINVDDYVLNREGFQSALPVVGRHSRPDPQKWPDTRETFLEAYPACDDIAVHLMGYGPEQDRIVLKRPENWHVQEFDAMPVRRFLGKLDFFVYYHSNTWIEAFGRSILEAIASGAIAVLPEHFRPLFGEAALYSSPKGVADLVRSLHSDPIAFSRQSAAAVDFARERFGLDVGAARVRRLIGPPQVRTHSIRAVPSPANGKVLFFTSNGIGMGHLTRALAVARRLSDECTPVIASLSKAFGVAGDVGIESTYITYHKSVGMEYNEWQMALQRETSDLLAYHKPNVFVFDGNVPYPGMMAALAQFPETRRIWQRRGMWAPGAGQQHIDQQPLFDAVIEPGELAEAFDRGLTTENKNITVQVPPILYLDRNEMLSRTEARRELDLPEDGTAVLLQLGSENNFDLSSTRAQVLEKLKTRTDISMVNAEWLIRDAPTELPEGVGQIRRFPISRFLGAFDFAVSSAGYNTFHENIYAGLPTIFVANENPEQDEQWRRAHYAELRGLALASRRFNPHALNSALDRMLDDNFRDDMRQACLNLDPPTGAAESAGFISDMAYFRR